uniref:Branched-chain-amino-acid aminotransferase n=1 Tax=Alexandrium andersonii TaxID=327968 RepID=A0A7S2J356_9DINO
MHPATEAMLLVMVSPVGAYYNKGGTLTPVPAAVVDGYDRAAPKGVGHCKVAGNYAADMKAAADGKKRGYPIGLYLDPKERRFVEEFNSSNFIAISGKKYLTPESASILPSVTNRCLAELAKDLGLEVERRPVELAAEADTFDEVGAVGTAVVVTPIKSITMGDKTWEFKAPDTLQKLHDKMRRVQQGEEEDTHNFLREIAL